MKKNWKVIVGAVFLVGGFGCIGSDMGSAVFGILVGIALIAWWILGRRSTASNNSTEEKTLQSSHSVHQAVSPVPSISAEPKEAPAVVIPEKKDGASLAYRYSVPFSPSNPDALLSAAKEKRWYLSAKQMGREIHLFSEGTDLGVLNERADMVSDWIRRNEPYLIILERMNSETGCTVMLVFYRDKQKYYANKEQAVTALTGYKSEDKQAAILSLNAGDELEAEEDYEKEGRVLVSDMGEAIGSLPKKYAERFISEGASLIIFDHGEEDEENSVTKPFIKIFW